MCGYRSKRLGTTSHSARRLVRVFMITHVKQRRAPFLRVFKSPASQPDHGNRPPSHRRPDRTPHPACALDRAPSAWARTPSGTPRPAPLSDRPCERPPSSPAPAEAPAGRQPSTSSPFAFPRAAPSRIMLLRQSATVPNTSNVSALIGEKFIISTA